MLVILEAFRFFSISFHSKLVVEHDSLNSIFWVSSPHKIPWRFHFYFNEIFSLTLSLEVSFKHMGHSTNGFADAFAKQGMGRSSNLRAIPL